MPYLVAGAETVYGTFHKWVKEPDTWQFRLLKNFMDKTEAGYLFSFGNGLSNSKAKKDAKIKGKYAKAFSKFFKKDTFQETNKILGIDNIVMDSGGYQAQSGYLTLEKCYEFIEEYKDFILTNHENFKYFFSLDLIPDNISYNELLDLNQTSFETLNSLPANIKEKIIFIYHFFTPKVHKVWQEVISKNYFNQFSNYFAFGGLAAKDTVSVSMPIAVFAIGIVKIVENAKLHGIKKLKMHILGAASYRDIMLYQLYKAIIKKYHDVEIDITYDSSLVFKQIQKSRCINIIEKDFTNNLLSIREKGLGKYIYRNIDGKDRTETAGGIVLEKMRLMVEEVYPECLPEFDQIKIYEPKSDGTGNSLSKDFSLLSILFSGWQYNRLEKQCQELIQSKLYLLDEDDFLFYDDMIDILLRLNANKLSYKFKDKMKYIRTTVECLIDLDGDYINNIVNNALSASEIIDKSVTSEECLWDLI